MKKILLLEKRKKARELRETGWSIRKISKSFSPLPLPSTTGKRSSSKRISRHLKKQINFVRRLGASDEAEGIIYGG